LHDQVKSDQFIRPAKRPKNSVLCTDKYETETGITPRFWQDALKEYVEKRIKNEEKFGK